MKPSQECIDMVKHFEGFEDTAYLCPANVWTIGYGRTKNVKEGDKITEPQAERDLQEELQEFGAQVLGLLIGTGLCFFHFPPPVVK